ncbi:MAG: cation-translocating P-type ATPase, partial [Planctomycetes bacterium]|nr:cation-translocating P-type ATPase [Planctomycetota bacterium]
MASGELPVTLRLRIEGMTCGSCVARVERALLSDPGVKRASVNLVTEIVQIDLADPPARRADLIAAVQRAGYDADTVRRSDEFSLGLDRTQAARLQHQRQGVMHAVAMGVPIIAIHFLAPMLQSADRGGGVWPLAIEAILCSVLLLSSAGAPILVAGWRALIHRSPNMDLLVSLGVSAAYVSGVASLFVASLDAPHFHAAAMILGFINLGRLLELKARRTATSAISALARRMPSTAHRVQADGIVEVPVGQLSKGDHVRVAQDTVVPVDGVIIDGNATMDESAVTGESMPRERKTGDEVSAGTVVRDGLITVEARRVGSESTVGRIIRAVEEAQSGKTRMQRIADRTAGYFVPVVVVVAVLTFVGWAFIGHSGAATAVNRAVAVLVIACPCAMGLATPMAVMVATGTAATRQILVRNAAALEAAGRIDVMLIDKTGTLTTGIPAVREVFDDPIGPITRDAREVVKMAASAERYSQHPLARAIVARAREWGLELVEPSSFSNEAGLGVRARCDGHDVLVGSHAMLAAAGVDTSIIEDRLSLLTTDGQTAVLLAVDGICAGLISFSDVVRPEASRAIESLESLGVATAMLTGDSAATAASVAAGVGIREVHAELSPEGKSAAIAQRREAGMCVAFVGDGINDAPALAAADVGITFASATDVAIGAADITILRDDLGKLPEVIALARRSVRVIKQNLFWAFFYNIAAIPLAIMGKIPPGIAAAAMMCSSISVVLNSLRLRRMAPPDSAATTESRITDRAIKQEAE